MINGSVASNSRVGESAASSSPKPSKAARAGFSRAERQANGTTSESKPEQRSANSQNGRGTMLEEQGQKLQDFANVQGRPSIGEKPHGRNISLQARTHQTGQPRSETGMPTRQDAYQRDFDHALNVKIAGVDQQPKNIDDRLEKSTTTARLVGAVQVLGGGLEVALGIGGAIMPEPATTIGGVILIAHGSDTIAAGFRSLWYGEVAETYTAQGAENVARAAGAPEGTAEAIGVGADLVAGLGPSMAVTASRRIAMSAATSDAPKVMVAYANAKTMTQLTNQPTRIGHNMVGVSREGSTAWFEFRGISSGRVMEAKKAPLASEGFIITPLRVTSTQAARGEAAADMLRAAGKTPWSACGPNCTTTASKVLREAGVVIPAWAQTPSLLAMGVRAGGEITVIGAASATGARIAGQ